MDLFGKTILEADVFWARTLAIPTVRKFKEKIRGQKITGVSRRAKYLIIQLKNYNLLVHLRMSGDLLLRESKINPNKHDRLVLRLSGKYDLAFNDTRKFGRVWFTDDPQSILKKLGPEPLEKGFTADWLYKNLQSRKRQLKPLLLDQTFIAGLGNIYTDEFLNIAKLHPLAQADTVKPKQAKALYQAI